MSWPCDAFKGTALPEEAAEVTTLQVKKMALPEDMER